MTAPARHFELQQLAPGVWAAIQRADGWLVANAGIVDLGDQTLLFDAGMTPQAGEALRRASVTLTGRPPAVVLLSHFHNDHVRGAQVFPEALLVSGTATRTLLDTAGREELERDRREARRQLERARALRADPSPLKQQAGELFVPYWEAMLASLPQIELQLPTLTVQGDLTFHGAARRAVFRVLGGGHTAEDAVLHLPDDGVVFCGDLLFVRAHPFLGHGSLEGALAALEQLEQLRATMFVPGHGPVGGSAELAAMRRYLRQLAEIAANLPAEEGIAARVEVPAAYRDWWFAYPFFQANLEFLLAR